MLEMLMDDLPKENLVEKIYFRTSQADLLICQGEWAKARNLLTQIKNKYSESGLLLYTMVIYQCLAQLSLEENRFGKFNEWQEIEETLSRYIESSEPGLSFLPLWLYLLAQVRARQGRLEEARLLIQKLRQECAVQASQEHELIVTIAEGELAYAEGRWTEAIQHVQWRIDYHVRTEERWAEARSMLDLGEAYLKRNETGDKESARGIFLRLADMFAEMGAEVYADIALSRLESIDQGVFP
jgi:ATP/maltotriose-dependent transcriptional regulator MalT